MVLLVARPPDLKLKSDPISLLTLLVVLPVSSLRLPPVSVALPVVPDVPLLVLMVPPAVVVPRPARLPVLSHVPVLLPTSLCTPRVIVTRERFRPLHLPNVVPIPLAVLPPFTVVSATLARSIPVLFT